jgi:hypothetical protein
MSPGLRVDGEAAEIIRLDHVKSDSDAHMDVSLRMRADADELLAVWIVSQHAATAEQPQPVNKGLLVKVVWPTGAIRD